MSPRRLIRFSLLACAWVFILYPQDAVYAYQVSCGGVSFQAKTITSVFGEARPSVIPGTKTTYTGVPNRFHMGIDIQDQCKCANPADLSTCPSVEAIRGGTVIDLGGEVPGCSPQAKDCIRIQDSAGHAFDYIHVSPIVNDGDSVNAGNPIGTIDAANHLHLDDVDLSAGVKRNPETNGLDFFDSNVPQFDTITVGGVTADLIPIDDDTLSPLSPSSQGETFLSPLFRGYGEPT